MLAERIAIDDDDRLDDAFAARDGDAFDRAYARYAPMLVVVAARVLGNSADARDCVHDALARVWEQAAYRRARGSLRAFLVVCVRNEALTLLRADTRHRSIEREARRTDVEHVISDAERPDPVDVDRLRHAIDVLPNAQRDALLLAYHASLSQSEIARRLNVPLGTVKSRIAAAVRAIAAAVLPPEGRD